MKLLYAIILLFVMNTISAQKYYTRSGNISFYSDAPLEKIEAHNSNATAVLDLESGAIEWAVLIKGFGPDNQNPYCGCDRAVRCLVLSLILLLLCFWVGALGACVMPPRSLPSSFFLFYPRRDYSLQG